MTLIKELISLPEKVFRGDFVLNLSAGVQDAQKTVDTYVVTDQLVTCFDDALTFVKGALDGRSSRACYLHGSFGSGKSHFMAILHLLLHRDVSARSIAKLAPIVAKHNAWTDGKKVLLIPYHMIGASNMESAILGGYAEHVQRLRPDAPVPAVYKSELLLQNARRLRQQMGDDSFFQALNSGSKSGGWGELEGTWDTASFERAATSAPTSEERVRLVGDLVKQLLPMYAAAAANDAAAFVDLDSGLSIISKHAQDLGYDGVILFLDELVLWLAARAADVDFVHREGQKLAKLVEAQRADRPVPIVSFVARQRDLRELVGENITGAEQLRFSDALKHWEGRFATIKLEDRNLPAIAAERVLKPRGESARQQIDTAFKETERFRQEVTDTLLTSQGSRDMFRKVYPFSPALMDTLVAVSSMLQRERTALKVMLELLVDQRDTLKLGDIVPAGDLWDYVAHGDEAFIDEMRRSFDAARRLYHEQLLPMLEQDPEHPIRKEDALRRPPDDPVAIRFRNDERLLKTLLLAALVPQVESFRGMTGAKLAALNHGTIRSPIPGREGQMVLAKCRNWGARVGQIRFSDDSANPTVSIMLTGVDTESILEKAKSEDNHGNRRRKIWEILCEQFGIENIDELQLTHETPWRGTKRPFDVLFANVRELPDVSLQNDGPAWKVVVDFPFDVEGRGPADDLARIDQFRDQVGGRHLTIVWLPTFLSLEVQRELGKLVLLDHCLKDERFNAFAAHLSPMDRASARALMDNQRSQLRQKMVKCLEAAYGTDNAPPGALDTTHEMQTHVYSIDESFKPQPPVGANLSQQLEQLVAQALEHQYPAHPLFDGEVRTTVLKNKVLPEVQRAIQASESRILIDQPNRQALALVVGPLKLGEMNNERTHFILGNYWKSHFERKHAAAGGPITVEKLTAWIDEPTPMGLTKEVRNLLILTFAEQTNRSFFRHGGPHQPTLEDVPKDLELRSIDLPPKADWDAAVKRGAAIFGVSASPLLNAANLAKFSDDVRTLASQYREPCAKLAGRLGPVLAQFGIDKDASPRHRTAMATAGLLEAVQAGRDDVVPTLVKAGVPTTEAAMGTSLKKATGVLAALDQPVWHVFEGLGGLAGDKQLSAQAILKEVKEALNADEHAVGLATVLSALHERAVKLLLVSTPTPPPTSTPELEPVQKGWEKAERGRAENLDAAGFEQLVEQLRQKIKGSPRLTIRWETYREKK